MIAVKRRIYKEKRRKRDRQGREKALLAAATRLFAAQGYEATTTREIAAAARCAEGLIHRYFQGKAGLLGAMVKAELSRNGCDRLDEHVPAPRFEDEILRLVHWEVERVWSEREFLRVMIPQLLNGKNTISGDTLELPPLLEIPLLTPFHYYRVIVHAVRIYE